MALKCRKTSKQTSLSQKKKKKQLYEALQELDREKEGDLNVYRGRWKRQRTHRVKTAIIMCATDHTKGIKSKRKLK